LCYEIIDKRLKAPYELPSSLHPGLQSLPFSHPILAIKAIISSTVGFTPSDIGTTLLDLPVTNRSQAK